MTWLLATATLVLGLWLWALAMKSKRWLLLPDGAPVSGTLSFITAVRNRPAGIWRLDEWLSRLTSKPDEWVVIDDGSTPPVETPGRATTRIRIHYRPSFGWHKKAAVRAGIRLSQGSLLCFTDADCQPSDQWFEQIRQALTSADIVVGYSPLRAHNWVGYLAQWDQWLASLHTFGLAAMGRPYMATGRNLAYRRHVFFHTQEFKTHEHIPSGDDDLLLQEALKKGFRVRYLLHPATWVWTDAPRSLRQWMRQRQRHTETAFYYDRKIRTVLGLFWLGWIGTFWLSIGYLAFNPLEAAAVLVLRWLSWLAVLFYTRRIFVVPPWQWVPLLDSFLCTLYTALAFSQLKGRMV